jgi:hypothetical protein
MRLCRRRDSRVPRDVSSMPSNGQSRNARHQHSTSLRSYSRCNSNTGAAGVQHADFTGRKHENAMSTAVVSKGAGSRADPILRYR